MACHTGLTSCASEFDHASCGNRVTRRVGEKELMIRPFARSPEDVFVLDSKRKEEAKRAPAMQVQLLSKTVVADSQ